MQSLNHYTAYNTNVPQNEITKTTWPMFVHNRLPYYKSIQFEQQINNWIRICSLFSKEAHTICRKKIQILAPKIIHNKLYGS